MARYIDIKEARTMLGARLTLIPGVAGPWGEAAKGILHVKGIPYVRVRHQTPRLRDASYIKELQEWTGQTSYPVLAYNDERPRSGWADILFQAERIAPEPSLIPQDLQQRALMFGYSRELCGEMGLAWSQRLMLFDDANKHPDDLDKPVDRGVAEFVGSKYGFSDAMAARAPYMIADTLRLFARRLAKQRARGSRFLIGNQFSALDIYWATFFTRISPLPAKLCDLEFREYFIKLLAENHIIGSALEPALFEHRDFIYHNYLELPVEL